MESAGQPGAYASIVRHIGRTSGTSYDNPVQAFPTEDGFVIGLPYGTRADWVKNVLAAGSATITHEGETYEVDQPHVVPYETVVSYFSPETRRSHRLFGTDQCLRVRRMDTPSVSA